MHTTCTGTIKLCLKFNHIHYDRPNCFKMIACIIMSHNSEISQSERYQRNRGVCYKVIQRDITDTYNTHVWNYWLIKEENSVFF